MVSDAVACFLAFCELLHRFPSSAMHHACFRVERRLTSVICRDSVAAILWISEKVFGLTCPNKGQRFLTWGVRICCRKSIISLRYELDKNPALSVFVPCPEIARAIFSLCYSRRAKSGSRLPSCCHSFKAPSKLSLCSKLYHPTPLRL